MTKRNNKMTSANENIMNQYSKYAVEFLRSV
ncbi:hypothetical protein C8C76_1479 [Halanaerobium saccharolyticum]|jgi:hypothetical protein|uniref:Uncharacterized protein n=1 Tax=Halanaerobium saccharolyticum TaxID=43595 RepID=A0A2T5RFR9_9FIRM|nr:hypothetical protein C8C76_1479 [Halanaerobium saccharolyticum]